MLLKDRSGAQSVDQKGGDAASVRGKESTSAIAARFEGPRPDMVDVSESVTADVLGQTETAIERVAKTFAKLPTADVAFLLHKLSDELADRAARGEKVQTVTKKTRQ